MQRPENLFNRATEWADLTGFVSAGGPPLRLGIVYGRRRFGKSFLLRRLTEATEGLYHLALQEERRSALDRFAATVSRRVAGAPPLRFDGWSDALAHAVSLLGDTGGGPQVLVLDEYPYLRQTSPELDSAVQALMDESASGGLGRTWQWPVTVVVCGSAMSVMTSLLSGTSPMRGRAALEMALSDFDFRDARGFWAIADPATALNVDAVLGGAAGYRDLTAAAGSPARVEDLAPWLAATVLNPSHALFREDEYLLREDPRVTVEAPYYSLLGAIAAGRGSPRRIAEAVGRSAGDIVYHLDVMTSAGFVNRSDDLLVARRPTYRVADPIVRFHHLITRPRREMLEDRRAAEVWAAATDTFRSNILGPHFESVCRRWVDRHAAADTLGGPLAPARRAQVNDKNRRQRYEVDVAATAAGAESGRPPGTKVVQVIGEAKLARLDVAALHRLDQIAGLMTARRGVEIAPQAKRLLFSATGFGPNLQAAADKRHDVELVDLHRLYEGT